MLEITLRSRIECLWRTAFLRGTSLRRRVPNRRMAVNNVGRGRIAQTRLASRTPKQAESDGKCNRRRGCLAAHSTYRSGYGSIVRLSTIFLCHLKTDAMLKVEVNRSFSSLLPVLAVDMRTSEGKLERCLR